MKDNTLKPIVDAVDKEVRKYEKEIERLQKTIEKNQSLILDEEQKIEEADVAKGLFLTHIQQAQQEINEAIGAIKALQSVKKVL